MKVGVFTSTGVTGYKGIRVTFCNVFKWRKVTLLPCYRVTPVLVNTPSVSNLKSRILRNNAHTQKAHAVELLLVTLSYCLLILLLACETEKLK